MEMTSPEYIDLMKGGITRDYWENVVKYNVLDLFVPRLSGYRIMADRASKSTS